jgi:hypothetical protein
MVLPTVMRVMKLGMQILSLGILHSMFRCLVATKGTERDTRLRDDGPHDQRLPILISTTRTIIFRNASTSPIFSLACHSCVYLPSHVRILPSWTRIISITSLFPSGSWFCCWCTYCGSACGAVLEHKGHFTKKRYRVIPQRNTTIPSHVFCRNLTQLHGSLDP